MASLDYRSDMGCSHASKQLNVFAEALSMLNGTLSITALGECHDGLATSEGHCVTGVVCQCLCRGVTQS